MTLTDQLHAMGLEHGDKIYLSEFLIPTEVSLWGVTSEDSDFPHSRLMLVAARPPLKVRKGTLLWSYATWQYAPD